MIYIVEGQIQWSWRKGECRGDDGMIVRFADSTKWNDASYSDFSLMFIPFEGGGG